MKTKKLPIGSIVEFSGNKTKLMIIGKDIIKNNIKYDYMCVVYPYGYIKEQNFVYANDESVVLLWHLGNIN